MSFFAEADTNELKEKLEIYKQTIKSLELEQQEYHSEIARIQSLNKELQHRNDTLSELQEDTRRDIDVIYEINRQTSKALEPMAQIRRISRQKTQIADELMQENIDLKHENDIYQNRLEGLIEKVTTFEKESKSTQNQIEQLKQENIELEDMNQILQHQVSQMKIELKCRDRSKSVVATPTNPISKFRGRQTPVPMKINMGTPLSSLELDTASSPSSDKGLFSFYTNRSKYMSLRSLNEGENESSDMEMEQVFDEYDLTLKRVNTLTQEVERMETVLDEKDAIIESLQEEIWLMGIINEKGNSVKQNKLGMSEKKKKEFNEKRQNLTRPIEEKRSCVSCFSIWPQK